MDFSIGQCIVIFIAIAGTYFICYMEGKDE